MGWPVAVSMSTTTTIFVTAKQTWRSLDNRFGSISPLLHFHNLVGCKLQPSRGVGIDYDLQNFNALDIYSLGGGTCPPVSYFYYKYQKSMNVTMQCVDRWILWIATSKPTGCSVWRRRKYLATFDQFPEDSEKPLNPASVLGCELACVGTAGSGTKQD